MDGTAYTDTGTYTFHVGPVAELEVRDVGVNPGLPASQRAYTVMDVNNGPDAALAVQATLTEFVPFVTQVFSTVPSGLMLRSTSGPTRSLNT